MRLLAGLLLLIGGCLWSAGPVKALDPARALTQYKHTRWMIEDGAPQGIHALAQAADGYLWIGADTGLYRFDGVTFEQIGISPDLVGENQVTALFTARSGDLWVGFVTGRILRIHQGQQIDVTPPDLKGPVWSFAEDLDGAIWILTRDTHFNLGRYAQGKWTHIDSSWGLQPSDRLGALAMGNDGTVWTVRNNRLFLLRRSAHRFEDGEVTFSLNPGLAADAHGRMWFSDAKLGTGPLFFPANSKTVPAVPLYPVTAKSALRTILFDRSGNLWGTTLVGGIFRIRTPDASTGKEEVFDAANGLSADDSGPIIEDREGDIWIGTTTGLDRFRAANVAVETGIPQHSRWGYTLLGDSRGTIYAEDSDTVYRIHPDQTPNVLLDHVNNPQAMCESPDGALWVTSNDGAMIFRDGHIAKMTAPNPNLNDCAATPDSSLWFSSNDEGFYRFTNQRWQHIPNEATGVQPDVLLADREGRLLASKRFGDLKLLDFPRVETLWKAKDIPGGDVRVLYQGARYVLIGCAEGLARFYQDHIQVLRAHYSWLNGVSGLVETPQGETWVFATNGLARLSTFELDKAFIDPKHRLNPELFDLRDGLQPATHFFPKNSAARGADGRLWFVTSDAIVWVDPAHLARNRVPPPVSIHALLANGERHIDPHSLTLPEGTSSLEIDYTALSLSIPERVRFRYRLDGIDHYWIDPGARRQAFYTNLGPGTYRFGVVAANNDGVWNRKGATLEFTIPPTFFQSNWFLLMCILALGALLWLAFSMRMHQVAARARAGLEAKMAERERIARELHDTLLQGFQGLVLRFQSVANRIPHDQPLRPEIDLALDRAEAVLIEGRDRVRDLREPTADLTQVLTNTAGEFAADSRTNFNLTVEGIPRALLSAVDDEIQRIGEEAIRNAFRHAHAKTIEAVLTYRAAELRFQLRDDGVGLSAEVLSAGERDGHFGLLGMRERAKRIGGTLTISSRVNSGTEIELSIPGLAAYVGARSQSPWWSKFLTTRSKG